MLMWFHWGLAVGHIYTHQQQCSDAGVVWGNTNQTFESRNIPEEGGEVSDHREDDVGEPSNMDHTNQRSGSHTDGSGSESDNEDYEPSDEDDDESSNLGEDEDSEWLDIDEMHGHEELDDDFYEG